MILLTCAEAFPNLVKSFGVVIIFFHCLTFCFFLFYFLLTKHLAVFSAAIFPSTKLMRMRYQSFSIKHGEHEGRSDFRREY